MNGIQFREFWDAELRGSIYLDEFIRINPGWQKTLTDAIDIEGYPKLLNDGKGEQLLQVIDHAVDREERFFEIMDQHQGDGAIKYWLGMLDIDAASDPATYLLIRVARRVGEVVVMCLKEQYGIARPSQVCPAIIPMVDPPVTPSFPSGHALQSRLISKCLEAAGRPLTQRNLLFKLAERVAENRVIAGLHYPLDNLAGFTAADSCFTLLARGEKFKDLLKAARLEGEKRQRKPEAQT